MFCGVDEAGKGAVLGPMVVAAVGCTLKDDLAKLPVKDSKKLSPVKRDTLYDAITRAFPVAVRVIQAGEIDSSRRSVTMNALLAQLHAEVITELAPELAYVDACDVIAPRYGRMVSGFLGVPCRIIAEHHADDNIPIVSAASIVAKVIRDREVRLIADSFGAIGSGYPSDPETVDYLRRTINESGKPPEFARRSWQTVCDMIREHEQSHLFDFS